MAKLSKKEQELLKTLEKDVINNNSLAVDEKCSKLAECVKQYTEGTFLCSSNLLGIIFEKLQAFQNLQKQQEQEKEYEKIKKKVAERYGFQKIQVDLNDEISVDLFPWVSSETKWHIQLWINAGIVKTYQDLIYLINNAYDDCYFYTIKSAIEHVITEEQSIYLNSHMFGCSCQSQWTHIKDAEVFSMLDSCGFGNMIFEHKYYLADTKSAEPVNLERFADKKDCDGDIFNTYEDVIYYLHYPDTHHSSYYKIILAY